MKRCHYSRILFVATLLWIFSQSGSISEANMINPHTIKWNIKSIVFVDKHDLGQYKEVPGGCAVDPLPPGGDIIHNGGSEPIKLDVKNINEKNIINAPKDGKLAIIKGSALATKGELTGRPDWWALDVGIGSGWIIPCSSVSIYSDDKGSIWTVKEDIKNKPSLSMLTRKYDESQPIEITLIFKLKKWQVPRKGTNVKLLLLSPATQALVK